MQVGEADGVAALGLGHEVVGELQDFAQLPVGDRGYGQFVDLVGRVAFSDHRVGPGQGVVEEAHGTAEGRSEHRHALLRLEMGHEVVADVQRLAPLEKGEGGP